MPDASHIFGYILLTTLKLNKKGRPRMSDLVVLKWICGANCNFPVSRDLIIDLALKLWQVCEFLPSPGPPFKVIVDIDPVLSFVVLGEILHFGK